LKYSCTVISVSDVNASRRFYEDVFGLKVYQDYGKCVGFTCGLSLMQDFEWLVNVPKEKVMKEPNNIELCFEEEKFDDFLKKLKGYGVRYLHDATEQPWGQRVIHFYDPDGHIIEVGEDMKAVTERFLSSGMTKEETAKRMNVSVADVETLMKG